MAGIESIFPSDSEGESIAEAWIASGFSGVDQWELLRASGFSYTEAAGLVKATAGLSTSEQGAFIRELLKENGSPDLAKDTSLLE